MLWFGAERCHDILKGSPGCAEGSLLKSQGQKLGEFSGDKTSNDGNSDQSHCARVGVRTKIWVTDMESVWPSRGGMAGSNGSHQPLVTEHPGTTSQSQIESQSSEEEGGVQGTQR